MKHPKFPIYLQGERILSNAQKAFTLEISKKIGEKIQKKIIYSPYEAFYLVETGKAEIINMKNNNQIKENQLITILSKKNKDFSLNYAVFKKLKNKGYIVKTGSKFGAEFRVYCNSMNKHARWLVYPVKQSEKSNWNEFISKNRIAHSTGKKLLLAIADNEDVLFYEINWMKL